MRHVFQLQSRPRHQRGSLLVEIIVVTFLFAIIGTGLLSTVVTSTTSSKQAAENIVAAGYIKEGIEAVRSIRDQDWALITNGSHGLTTTSGYYELSGTSNSLDSGTYTRTITIEDVYRTGSLTGDIAASGVLDANTKKITVNITWDTLDDNTQNIDAVYYVTNWEAQQSWVQTLTADFNAGTSNSVSVTSTSDGEVELGALQADWSGLEEVYAVDLDGNGDRVAAQYDAVADILYILATSTTGYEFSALDVSGISDGPPTVINGIDLSGLTADDMVVHNGYAYIATNENSTEVIVVDVTTMTQVNTIDLDGNTDATGIDATGNTLVISRGFSADDEVYFYDISDPEGTLTELGSTSIAGDLSDIVTSSSYAFAASDENSKEVFVIRLSDYTEVNSVDLNNGQDANTLELVGDNLYVGRDDGTGADIHVLDVSSPEGSITQTSSLDIGANVYDLVLDPYEEYLVLATSDNNSELVVIDVATFTELETGDVSGNDDGISVAVFGAFIYLGTANNSEDFVIFTTSTSTWLTPTQIASADLSGTDAALNIFVDGSFTYVVKESGSADELFIYDTTTPSSPTYLGSFDVGADVEDIIVDGDYVYLATSDNSRELDIINVATKSSPTREGSYDTSRNNDAFSITKNGDTVYLGREKGSADELWIIDVTTPSTPTVLGSMDTDGDLMDLVIDGTNLFAATSDNSKELNVFDVTTSASPSELTSYNLTGNTDASALALSGDTLALGRLNNGSTSEIYLFDISTPSSPTLLGEGDVGASVNNLSMGDEQWLYVATEESAKEFQRWDIRTSSTPTEYSAFDLTDDGEGVFFDGTYAYVATEASGAELQIIGPTTVSGSYARSGTMTSQAFDSGSSSTSWGAISWTESGTGDIEFRIRTANSEANLETATWVGSDGTSSSSYSTSETSITTDSGATGTQWIQWKAYLTGSGSATPVLEDVTVTY